MTTETTTPAMARAREAHRVAAAAARGPVSGTAGERPDPHLILSHASVAAALDVEEMARAGYAHRARRQIDAGEPPEWWPYWSDLSDERRKQELDRAAAVRASIVGGAR